MAETPSKGPKRAARASGGSASAGSGASGQARRAKPAAAASASTGAGRPARAASASSTKGKAPAGKPAAGKAGSRKSSGKGSSKARKRGLFGRIVRGVLIAMLVVALAGTAAGWAFYERAELPDPNADFGTQTTRLYFNDGTTELGSLAVQNRTVIPYAEMPQSIKDAVVAAEDRTFWTNQGIDLKGMARAVWGIVRNREITGGGSTITQQYIKIRYLTSEQTLSRKFTELALAIKMNKAETKESVLEGYLNTIYFGRGAYGIQAAARAFFQVDAKDMNLGQSAALAAILNSPSNFDPANGEETRARLLERYNYVLDGMLNPMATITQAQHDEFYGVLPDFPDIPIDNVYGGPNGFLIRMAIDELEAKGFTPEQINGGGLKIVTTFNHVLQQAAIDAAQSTVAAAVENANPLRNPDGTIMVDAAGNPVKPDPAQLHVGLASIEVGTGAVLALYGGPDFVANSRNWATTPRYAASTFKMWGAVAGLRNGFGLSSTLRGNTYTPEGDTVPVHNDSGYNYGTVTLQKAIQDSINTSFVDLIARIPDGTSELIRAANDAGIPEHPSWAPQANRMVLGQAEVSSLANTTGYATLANNGVRNETHVVAQVIDPAGNVVFTGNTEGVRAIEDAVARDLTYAMSGAVAGTTIQAVGGRAVAGKTGTSGEGGQSDGGQQITQSGWLAGYTKRIATSVVMVAGEDGNQNLDVYARPGSGAFYGAGYPTDVWNAYMRVAVELTDRAGFDPPANIQPTVGNTLPASTAAPSTPTESPTPTEPETTSEAPTTSEPPPTSEPAPPPTTTAAPPPVTSAAPPPTTTADPPPTTQPPPPPATTAAAPPATNQTPAAQPTTSAA